MDFQVYSTLLLCQLVLEPAPRPAVMPPHRCQDARLPADEMEEPQSDSDNEEEFDEVNMFVALQAAPPCRRAPNAAPPKFARPPQTTVVGNFMQGEGIVYALVRMGEAVAGWALYMWEGARDGCLVVRSES
ncbi:hypothetical protein TIFTF001_012540 [Ficus carica]|uniref:Uncharacterized protein n=1 Tax=Ficus carica TaxID=3494 RepID=A0AA88A1W2_FICCA|nr:hypothetical protein TIFTF001_012540 [Ficus carica]